MQIKQLILQTSYLQTLKEFYSSILELPVEELNEQKIVIRIGHSELIFTETKESEPFYHFAINIPANKIEEAGAWLNNKVELLWIREYDSNIADFVNWHAKSVYFFDPAGNILELIARSDRGNKREELFSSRQFLSVDEVGLVFDSNELELKTDGLLKNYSLSWFSKQPALPSFKALGNDEGLFIVVPEKRNWFPTDKPSGLLPIEVMFGNAGKEYRLAF